MRSTWRPSSRAASYLPKPNSRHDSMTRSGASMSAQCSSIGYAISSQSSPSTLTCGPTARRRGRNGLVVTRGVASKSNTSSLNNRATSPWPSLAHSKTQISLTDSATLSSSRNRSTPSLGNRPYSQKRDVYHQCQLLLTKALAERPKVGVNTKIDVAVAGLDPFTEWNEAAVIERQNKLTTLARSIWRLPQPSAG